MKNFAKFIMIGTIFLSGNSVARDCDSDLNKAVNDLAQIVGLRVAKNNEGENNIHIRLMRCEINNQETKIFANIETTWNGSININNFYNEDGLIEINLQEKNYSYKTTYRNERLRKWINLKGAAAVLYFVSSLE